MKTITLNNEDAAALAVVLAQRVIAIEETLASKRLRLTTQQRAQRLRTRAALMKTLNQIGAAAGFIVEEKAEQQARREENARRAEETTRALVRGFNAAIHGRTK